jgi:rhamnosyltransferase subunit B
MHFYLGAFGSAGDVHPMIGIGQALRSRGHDVTLVATSYFEPMARRAQLQHLDPMPDFDYRKMIEDPDLWHPVRGSRVLFGIMQRSIEPAYRLMRELHIPGQTVFVGSSLSLGMRLAHAIHGIPLATVHLSAFFFRSRTKGPRFYGVYRPDWAAGIVKDWQYKLIDALAIDRRLGPPINRILAEHGMPPARSILGSWLHSPELVLALFPDWFAPPQTDWPQQTVLTGFPLYDERETAPPSAELESFIRDGTPPIVFTPGSANIQQEASRFFQAAADACRRLGRRGMLLTRFRDPIPQNLPDGVRHFEFVPFSWLLPRAAAIVHHGGIGTMSQGLAAGIPQLIMPMNFDQHDNVYRLEQLGCGTRLSPRRFQGPAVAQKLQELLSSTSVAAACKRAAERIAGEKPLNVIADALEGFAARTQTTSQPSNI